MAFNVLGPFEAIVDASPTDVRGRQRAVLAALVLSANRTVSYQALTDYAWPEPPSTRNSLQTVVARLRRQLGNERIVTVGPGYLLRIDPAAVDALRFRELVHAARTAGDPDVELDLLRQALALWRGDPLADVPSERLRHEAGRELTEELLSALERRLDIDLEAGRHREVLGELRSLTAAHPLREALWQRLMLALHRCGRRADALEAYRTAAAAIRDQLGLDPGRHLGDLHQAILEDRSSLLAPPAATIVRPPRQLPPDVTGFTGREDQLARLDALIGPSSAVVIAAIDGAAGSGKTALAVHWAHRVSDLFPDGQLYVNLRGFGPGTPVEPADALETALRSLNVPVDNIPADIDARAAVFRSELAGRRMLIVLDNARDSDQVRPLLPGTDAVVLVTSRRQLRGLTVREGARRITVGQLTSADATNLLAGVIGGERVAREPAAAAGIVELCDRLPLTVRLAAEPAARHPGRLLGDLLTELHHQRRRLDTFSLDDTPSDLRAVFSWSYQALAAPAATLFGLLGLHPGNDVSTGAAAALGGVDDRQAAALLDELVSTSMLERRSTDRYELHDLLREYAAEVAETELTATGRDAAIGRLLDWYVHSAANAREKLTDYPHGLRLPTPYEYATPARFGGYPQAIAWWDGQRSTIAALVELAVSRGDHRRAAVLGELGWAHRYIRGHWDEMLRIGELTVASARAAGDQFLEAKALNGLATPYSRLHRTEDAIDACRRALTLFEHLGAPVEQLMALINIGSSYNLSSRYGEARDTMRQALALCETTGVRLSKAMVLNNLAVALNGLGHYADALDNARKAAAIFRDLNDPARLAYTLETEADASAGLGDRTTAIASYRDALDQAEHAGVTTLAVAVRGSLGRQLLAAGHRECARDVWTEALRTCEERDDLPAAQRLRGWLADLATPSTSRAS
ncbi:AfsR/SARP family transcriptional regulator [Fodinicola acaciae]|uniref:AfsR/SARP family transcriptional regulator n=1 Tax=Fodinicola acaciae TaxID=2681555 RepID=UPI0013CFB9BF|nr:BTAD domain-containing putative transcriptional regulator [Fodinicola acaciae]